MELRCCKDLVVGIFSLRGFERFDKSGDETRTGRSGIASIHNTSRRIRLDLKVFIELVVGLNKCLV